MNNSMRAAVVGMVALASVLASAAEPPVSPSSPGDVVEIVLPTEVGSGAPQEVKPVLDNAQLKLATIVLRNGSVLAEHSAPVAVTILALEGGGTATIGGKKTRVDAGHMVFVAAGVPHSVAPDAGTGLVLLVHHLKTAPSP